MGTEMRNYLSFYNMSKKLLISLGFALVACVAKGAVTVAGYDEALKKAKSDGVIVYCYGPDWNRRSVIMLDEFWKNPQIEKACGDAVMVAVPYYQRPTDEQQLEANKISGAFQRRKVNNQFRSFPAVCMVGKDGRIYAQLCGTDALGSEKDNYRRGYENISHHLELYRKQTELLAQAEKAEGLEKARFIGEASTLGIYPPDGASSQIKALDPQDTLGYVKTLSYDPYSFNMEANAFSGCDRNAENALSAEKTASRLQEILQNKTLTPIQKQESYAVYIGRLRKDGNGADRATLTKYIKMMGAIDPTSMYGKIVPHLLELWCNVPDRSRKYKVDRADKAKERAAARAAARAEREKARKERREQRRRK